MSMCDSFLILLSGCPWSTALGSSRDMCGDSADPILPDAVMPGCASSLRAGLFTHVELYLVCFLNLGMS